MFLGIRLLHRLGIVIITGLLLTACVSEEASNANRTINGSGPVAVGAGLGFTIEWTDPSSREDGSPFALSEIANYRVYYGTQSGNYSDYAEINATGDNSVNIPMLSTGTYYVSMMVIDIYGRESELSDEVVITI